MDWPTAIAGGMVGFAAGIGITQYAYRKLIAGYQGIILDYRKMLGESA